MSGDRVQSKSWPPPDATCAALAYYSAMAAAFFAMSSIPLLVVTVLLLTDKGFQALVVKDWVPIVLALASCVALVGAVGLWFRKPWASQAGQVAMLVAGT